MFNVLRKQKTFSPVVSEGRADIQRLNSMPLSPVTSVQGQIPPSCDLGPITCRGRAAAPVLWGGDICPLRSLCGAGVGNRCQGSAGGPRCLLENSTRDQGIRMMDTLLYSFLRTGQFM